MRVVAAVFVFACLSACGLNPAGSDSPSSSAAWRQHQATLDADAIMQGMARARGQSSEVARSAR